jgi:hydrogenase expression/formation protein HypE
MSFSLTCPLPLTQYPQILMGHGGGGRLMHQLIEQIFRGTFQTQDASPPHDAAILPVPQGGESLAFTTDSYVIHPLIFPGGDIGKLAICGTVNDLAMAGARPLYLSVGFILEEGLSMETLWTVVQSMQRTAAEVGVSIVTGDTKVVNRGKGDGIFINTAGIGAVAPGVCIAPQYVQPGDAILLSGDLGRHGIAIMAMREGLEFETTIVSDCAPLHQPVQALLEAGIEVHCLRDLTRGGLASALNEIAEARQLNLTIAENLIPVEGQVQGACEILGFDPLYVANEGRFIAFVPATQVDPALAILRSHLPPDSQPCCIGHVEEADRSSLGTGRVILKSRVGSRRFLELLSGEQLPRIC